MTNGFVFRYDEGFKQAPRIWYYGPVDNCVFYKMSCVVCVYVDFLVTGANDCKIGWAKKALDSDFKLNDLGIDVLLIQSTSQ